MSDDNNKAHSVTRRNFLVGVAGATAAVVGSSPTEGLSLEPGYDVIIIGGGTAGLTAALGVKREDPSASVLILESKPAIGGTSIRSGGRLWIPNNADLRASGLEDPKRECLRYMARMSYPDDYHPHARHMGINRRQYAKLEAFYDNGADMLDYFRDAQVMPWEAERAAFFPGTTDSLELTGTLAPDYRPDYEENIPKRGRSIVPLPYDALRSDGGESLPYPNYGASLKGMDLIMWLTDAAAKAGVTIVSGARVQDLQFEQSLFGPRRVSGVRATIQADDVSLPVQHDFSARRGVIFASGGYSKNQERLELQFQGLQSFSGGGCAVTSAQGDLLDIAQRHGLMLENMDSAWYVQNIYEQYRLDPDSKAGSNYLVFQSYWLNGDSMVMVNRRGQRVVNEKLNYHQRTQAHFKPDNRFLFTVFDQHCLENFMGIGGQITPAAQVLIGPANTVEELGQLIRARMKLYPETDEVGLGSDFEAGLLETLGRFEGYARSGVDEEFHRGESIIDLWWHAFCLYFNGHDFVVRENCVSANVDENGEPYPNPTMRPLKGPYYAIILSSGLQDTNGGPEVDEHARILDRNGDPVLGLYGAGNCIASPAGKGYWGAGGTLGPAAVFGHIAGRHAARRT